MKIFKPRKKLNHSILIEINKHFLNYGSTSSLLNSALPEKGKR